jgi:hypothetical protein
MLIFIFMERRFYKNAFQRIRDFAKADGDLGRHGLASTPANPLPA